MSASLEILLSEMRNILVTDVTIAGADLNYDSQDMATLSIKINIRFGSSLISFHQPNVTLQKKGHFTFRPQQKPVPNMMHGQCFYGFIQTCWLSILSLFNKNEGKEVGKKLVIAVIF